MKARNNKLLLFNSLMLRNKQEVIESFDDFVQLHRNQYKQEGANEGKRKILLSLCEEFRKELERRDIPPLTKPWFYYEYYITNDSIELSLLKCDEIEFDEDDEILFMSSDEEYILAKVECDYLAIEQYAALYGVTTVTVRQWIRRGKLRTAKKKGRDWLIPALADKPTRGFKMVTYHWSLLNSEIIEAFPFLNETNNVKLVQDEDDKKLFYAIVDGSETVSHQRVKLTAKEREKLEVMLISAPEVMVEDHYSTIQYLPAKRNTSLPILSYQDDEMTDRAYLYGDVIVKQHGLDTIHFAPEDEPGDSFNYPYTYLVSIDWTFWGVPQGYEDTLYDALDNEDYSDCTRLGTLSGYLILCKQMITDGYDPLMVCDDESADLEYTMSALIDEGGPLNEWTGEPLLDVLYIDELTIEEPLRRQGLGSRLLQETPSICRELLHVLPDIIAYYPAPTKSDWRKDSERTIALSDIAAKKIAKLNSAEEDTGAPHSNVISFADKYQLNDDEIKMVMGRRHSGSSYPEELKNEGLIAFYQKNGFHELGDYRLLYAYTEV